MTTDTSEKGLEAFIVADMTGPVAAPAGGGFAEESEPSIGLHNWLLGDPKAYDRAWTVNLVQLCAFIAATQPPLFTALDLNNDSPVRQKFLARVQGEIAKRGVIGVVRHGIKHGQHDVDLFYGTPSSGNAQAAKRFALNRFSVTRQLRYSRDDTAHALDLALFINGLPIATFELKNRLTKQTVEDAVEQYKRDRDPREKLFEFGRCMVHFAMDDAQVMFCTHLKGKASWFLPFNKGCNDGAQSAWIEDGLPLEGHPDSAGAGNAPDLARLGVLAFDQLRVVLNDVGEAQLGLAAQHMMEAQIIGDVRHQGVEHGIAGKAEDVVGFAVLRPVHRLDTRSDCRRARQSGSSANVSSCAS
jgi:hypothetical protein